MAAERLVCDLCGPGCQAGLASDGGRCWRCGGALFRRNEVEGDQLAALDALEAALARAKEHLDIMGKELRPLADDNAIRRLGTMASTINYLENRLTKCTMVANAWLQSREKLKAEQQAREEAAEEAAAAAARLEAEQKRKDAVQLAAAVAAEAAKSAAAAARARKAPDVIDLCDSDDEAAEAGHEQRAIVCQAGGKSASAGMPEILDDDEDAGGSSANSIRGLSKPMQKRQKVHHSSGRGAGAGAAAAGHDAALGVANTAGVLDDDDDDDVAIDGAPAASSAVAAGSVNSSSYAAGGGAAVGSRRRRDDCDVDDGDSDGGHDHQQDRGRSAIQRKSASYDGAGAGARGPLSLYSSGSAAASGGGAGVSVFDALAGSFDGDESGFGRCVRCGGIASSSEASASAPPSASSSSAAASSSSSSSAAGRAAEAASQPLFLDGCMHFLCVSCFRAHCQECITDRRFPITCPGKAASPASGSDAGSSHLAGHVQRSSSIAITSIKNSGHGNKSKRESNRCGTVIPEHEIRKALDDAWKHKFDLLSVEQALGGAAVKCPNPACGNIVEKVSRSRDSGSGMGSRRNNIGPASLASASNSMASASLSSQQSSSLLTRASDAAGSSRVEKDEQGKAMSAEAIAHRDEHRLRCRECESNFCTSCYAMPYHLGKTCDQARAHAEAEKCRFCDAVLDYQDSEDFAEAKCVLNKKLQIAKDDLVLALSHGAGGGSGAGRAAGGVGRPTKASSAAAISIAKSRLADFETRMLLLLRTCTSAECRKHANEACPRVHEGCGHQCGGVKGEHDRPGAPNGGSGGDGCLPCLDEECVEKRKAAGSISGPAAGAGAASSSSSSSGGGSAPLVDVNKEDYCNICFISGLGSQPCIQLGGCGHVFHIDCVRKIIKKGWTCARIWFDFLNCPLCKVPMHHWAIEGETAHWRKLQKTVEEMALARLKFEGRDKDAEVQPGGRYHGKPVAYAMDRFAYHVCYKCKKPYFGGARQCGEAAAGAQHAAAAGAGAGAAHAPAAGGGGGGVLGDNDLIDDGEEEERDPNKDLICSGCSKPPPGVTACPRHGTEGLEYKCRYCCSPAVWFCFGSTHFCEPCHSGWSGKPGGLKPQVCPGRATCPLGCDHPKNSAKEDGEFALGCYKCRADNTGF